MKTKVKYINNVIEHIRNNKKNNKKERKSCFWGNVGKI